MIQRFQTLQEAVEVDKKVYQNLKHEIENRDKVIVGKIVAQLLSQQSVVLVHTGDVDRSSTIIKERQSTLNFDEGE